MNMNTNTNENKSTKITLGPLALAEQYDDWKWKSTAKLITEGLWQPIAEGQKPPLGIVKDEAQTTAKKTEREALIVAQKNARIPR